ncbi:hypothetical protein GCM10010430_48880 [Kitasatospora cystarginea]|uniref:Uncharacterized protein n=1 Tax=Kitasatospora cystarginea TaxID=58350 RepID=A0ABP5RE82_9ACTN
MARTTPSRPADIVAVFPELAPLARQTVRLHPRSGMPTAYDSSVGGPLLWPADEPWPVCTEEHCSWVLPTSLGGVRRSRQLRAVAGRRPQQPGAGTLTPEERELLAAIEQTHEWTDEPNALLPVAQLYMRDVPGLRGPEGTDVLQVLWCPLDHTEHFMPKARLVWRSSQAVEVLLASPPEPVHVDHMGNYVPEPCALHPEVVTEYPAPYELDDELRERIWDWGSRVKAVAEPDHPYPDEHEAYYQYELSVAPGWKVGGWEPWSFSDPRRIPCRTCKVPMVPLLTIASGEWDAGNHSWIPVEDQVSLAEPHGKRPSNDPRVRIPRENMQIYICPVSFDHPHAENMQ